MRALKRCCSYLPPPFIRECQLSQIDHTCTKAVNVCFRSGVEVGEEGSREFCHLRPEGGGIERVASPLPTTKAVWGAL